MRLSFRWRVESVHEHFRQVHVSGVGENALFKQEREAWIIRFGPPQFIMIFTEEKPPFEDGDMLKISLEKVNE